MSTARTLSAAILKSSKAAAAHKYDTSKYVIVDLKVRRDSQTGRLVTKTKEKK